MVVVSVTYLIIIAKTAISIYSRFTSHKVNDLVTYIQNRDFHYEFIETHAGKHCSDISKASALIGACKDTPWLQVACTIALSTPSIIGSYEVTNNHIIDRVMPNTIAGRSGAYIGQVVTNPSEMSKSDWDTHISDMSNNDLLNGISCWYTLSS